MKRNKSIDKDYWWPILDSFYEGIYITSPQGLTLGVNQAYEKITGIEASRLIGRYMDDIVADGILSGSLTKQVIESGQKVTKEQQTQSGRRHIITGKPILDEDGKIIMVVTIVRNVATIESLQQELMRLREIAIQYKIQLDEVGQAPKYIAKNDAFKKAVNLAHKVANIDSTVLILGESGTGKEVVAREIHEKSDRSKNLFLKVNCGSIPEGLLESELFGYEKGAFTGASPNGHLGMFGMAHKGTILLDEIGELPLRLQVKLLRVLQDKVITRLGSTREIQVDTRIIAATNEDLEKMVLEKRFRKDLYYRLNVVHIHIPPLRERTDEIPALIEFFVDKINKRYKLHKRFHPQVIKEFIEYSWPGNVRELENVIERIMVTSESDNITRSNLNGSFSGGIACGENHLTISGIMPLQDAFEKVEKYLLREAEQKYKTTYQIASALKISQPSVSRKIKKYKRNLENAA